MITRTETPRPGIWLTASVIVLIAFALRTYAIADIPPGLTHDEVAQLGVSDKILQGDWRLFYADNYGVEPGYHYLLALSRLVLGENPIGWRFPAIFGGLLALVVIYVLAARWFGRSIGLLALGAAAVTWWPILLSRATLREIWEVPWYGLALYGGWRGIERAVRQQGATQLKWCVVGGVGLGLAQYVHTIPRGLFGVFVLFALYLLLFQRPIFKRTWRGLLLLIVVAELVAAPLLIYVATQPALEGWSIDLFQPDGLTVFAQRLPATLARYWGLFFWAGDDAWEFNVPFRPIFDPVAAIVFAVGLLVALRRWRQPLYPLVLISWAIPLVPGILFDATYPFPRIVTAQAATFALLGVGAVALGNWLRRLTPKLGPVLVIAACGWGLVSVARTGYDLFSVWPSLGEARSGYHAEQRDLARYVQAQPQVRPLAQCTLWIVFPGDPQYHQSIPHEAAAYFLPGVTDTRWYDCRYSLVIPAGGQFIFAHSDLNPLSNFLGQGFDDPWLLGAQPIPGVGGALSVDARSALRDQQARWARLPVTWPPEASAASAAQFPIDFNHAVELIGYQLPQAVKPGESVRVLTYWRVKGALPADLIAFTHLYRTPAEVLAQQDQLDVDATSLRPGDVFVQSHDFVTVPSDTPAGEYRIGIGLYRKDSGERWPIFTGEQRVADRSFLDHVQVRP
ncbi:MAG: glycosyltransferase family 39 protein [Thermoflexales bacterium]|nr:glycosyltransferase family 39 protein [Thermoflexales bacterium]